MKLSKQERIALMVIVAVVIIVLGVFLFIKPQFESLGVTMTNLDSKQQEYDAAVAKQATKADLRTQIEKAYEEGEHMADMFFPELTSYQADAATREFLAQCKSKVLVEQLSVSEPGTATLGIAFPQESEITYDLKTYATQGTEDAQKIDRINRQQTILAAAGDPQTIGASTVDFTVSAISQEELLKFCDEVNNYFKDESGSSTRKAIMLSGMSIEYPEVTAEYEKKIEEINKKAETAGRAALKKETGLTVEGTDSTSTDSSASNENEEKKNAVLSDNLYSVGVTLTFYSIERMQDPTAQLDIQDGIATA